MKVTSEKYKHVKNLLKLGVAPDEVADIEKVSVTTVNRIRKSTSFSSYHEISHKAVPQFYDMEEPELELFAIGSFIVVIIAIIITVTRVWL